MAKYFIWFIIYSFIGWTYETTLYSARQGRFVDSGMLYGCICPIYGLGALMVVFLFGGVQSPVLVFIGAAVATCALEYVVSWVIERMFGARWWDYSDWPANINGRVSLFSGIAFGIMSTLLIKSLHPALVTVTASIPPRAEEIAAAALFLIFTVDLLATANRCRNMPKSSEVNIVLKLSFDFLPKSFPSFAGLRSRARGVSSVVIDRGWDALEYITEKIKEFLHM